MTSVDAISKNADPFFSENLKIFMRKNAAFLEVCVVYFVVISSYPPDARCVSSKW